MNSLPTKALMGAGAVAMASVGVLAVVSTPSVVFVAFAVAASALVAFSTQSRRLRDEARLVYRPVYVRSQDVQRRVRPDLD